MSFNQHAFDKWDSAGKTAISGHLTAQGFTVTESGCYGIDFSVSGNGRIFNLDVEVRQINIWRNKFPFPTVEFSTRKDKFADDNSYFAVLDSTLTKCVVFPSNRVVDSSVVAKDVGRGEEGFHSVPIEFGKQIALIQNHQS